MWCGPSRVVNININGCGGFMPFTPCMPIGVFSPMYCGWGMQNPANIFGFAAGVALGNLAFRGVANLFNKMA